MHFCDDFFNDELNNYKVLQHIYRSRGEIQDEPPDSATDRKSRPNLKASLANNYAAQENLRQSNGKTKDTWPDAEPVVFNFRMP